MPRRKPDDQNFHLDITEWRGEVSQKLISLEKDLNDILTNHLPHLGKRIDKLERTIWMAVGGLAVLEFVFRFIFK